LLWRVTSIRSRQKRRKIGVTKKEKKEKDEVNDLRSAEASESSAGSKGHAGDVRIHSRCARPPLKKEAGEKSPSSREKGQEPLAMQGGGTARHWR